MKEKQTRSIVERFEAKIDKSGDCWMWTGYKLPSGYGQIWDGVSNTRAHRLSYEIYIGKISEGLFVLHKCDTPACVNPAHLFLGTAKDNAMDMMKKGRCSANILEDFEVLEIRDMRKNGYTGKELSEKYSVTQGTISRIVQNRTWKHL